MTVYIDDTDVTIDNLERTTTELTYEGSTEVYSVDTRFALELVRNALENANELDEAYMPHVNVLMDLLCKDVDPAAKEDE